MLQTAMKSAGQESIVWCNMQDGDIRHTYEYSLFLVFSSYCSVDKRLWTGLTYLSYYMRLTNCDKQGSRRKFDLFWKLYFLLIGP